MSANLAPAPIPLDVTGEALADLIGVEAARRKVTAKELAAELSRWPDKWLLQLRAAQRPKAATVARVRALLAGETVPPPPPNNFQSSGDGASYRPAPGSWSLAPAKVLPPRIDRDPCFRCGVRADVGCRHTLRTKAAA